jgi:hypothetical protein
MKRRMSSSAGFQIALGIIAIEFAALCKSGVLASAGLAKTVSVVTARGVLLFLKPILKERV